MSGGEDIPHFDINYDFVLPEQLNAAVNETEEANPPGAFEVGAAAPVEVGQVVDPGQYDAGYVAAMRGGQAMIGGDYPQRWFREVVLGEEPAAQPGRLHEAGGGAVVDWVVDAFNRFADEYVMRPAAGLAQRVGDALGLRNVDEYLPNVYNRRIRDDTREALVDAGIGLQPWNEDEIIDREIEWFDRHFVRTPHMFDPGPIYPYLHGYVPDDEARRFNDWYMGDYLHTLMFRDWFATRGDGRVPEELRQFPDVVGGLQQYFFQHPEPAHNELFEFGVWHAGLGHTDDYDPHMMPLHLGNGNEAFGFVGDNGYVPRGPFAYDGGSRGQYRRAA